VGLSRFALSALLLACSSPGTADSTGAGASEVEPIKECEAFLAAYSRCLGSSGGDAVTNARIEQSRAALTKQAATGANARDSVRRQCVDNLSQLSRACH
jgi:hypothetical protein